MPTPSLLQRLKERKLVQWGLAYLAGVWLVLQALDALETPLALTATIQRAILVIVIVGFFVTLILAWYHGEKGHQRVSGPELLMVAALLVVAGVAISVLPAGEQRPDSAEALINAGLEDDRPSIAALPWENRSGLEEDLSFTDGIHDGILTHLHKVGGLRVLARRRDVGPETWNAEIARRVQQYRVRQWRVQP